MTLNPTEKLLLGAVLGALILGVIIGDGCGHRPITHKDGKASVDSTAMAAISEAKRVKHISDSISQVNTYLAGYAAQLTREKDRWRRKAEDANDSVEFYITKYQVASKNKDTSMALASCDSIASEYQLLKTAAVETISWSDSTLKVKDDMMANLRVTMEAKDDQIKSLLDGQHLMANQYADLFKDYKKERRKDNWFNKVGKPVISAIAGGLIVYFIKQ